MKKIISACCVALLFMVSGCSDATTSISNESTALITVGNTKITKGEIYDALKAQGSVNSIINSVTEFLVEKEVEVTEEITENAKKTLENFKKYIGEDKWENFLSDSGYASEEDYFNDRVMIAARSGELVNKYLEQDYENAAATYHPVKVQIFETDNQETAEKALEAVKGGKEVKDVVTEFEGNTKNYTGETMIVTSESGLPSNVWSNITKVTDADTVLDTVQFSLDLTTFYVVKVVDTDANNFKEEAIATMASTTSIQNAGFAYFLDKYDFTIYDIDVYNAFKAQSPSYIVQK